MPTMFAQASSAPSFLAALLLCMALGCGGPAEYALAGSARAAGADGTIQVEEIEGGNRMVTLTIQHLAPPDRLGSGMTQYSVWFVRAGAQPQRAGNLEYDADARQGTMMATTPMTRFTVKITAEADGNAVAPSDVVVADREVGADED